MRKGLLWVMLLMLTVGTWNGVTAYPEAQAEPVMSGEVSLNRRSKAAIVADMRRVVGKVRQLEETLGQKNLSGYVVYAPEETARLFQLYQALQIRAGYLWEGVADESLQWAGNPVDDSAALLSYRASQVQQALADLEKTIPAVFLKDYRIFLAPFALSGISGMGGAGFSLIFSLPESFAPGDGDLRVTLYHELGHHIHLSYMPEETPKGKALWREYHDFRGGAWKKAGAAGTEEWSASSEETFSEDFRMVFGEDQPFFGDMVLGDPRVQAGVARAYQAFVTGLPEQTVEQSAYHSPWIPVNIGFWMIQEYLIAFLWMTVMIALVYYRGATIRYFPTKSASTAASSGR